ncbi:MAG: ABC transporter ATP-binding protein, partial [Bacteroidia bacterium]|nr:ABC transporter ATP-binding protein [Bacteroidia bacterium]
MLKVKELNISFLTEDGETNVATNINFSLGKNEILGIVGESGSGKSVTSLAVLGLLPKKKSIIEGSIRFNDVELLKLTEKELQQVRGNRISMIFQEPMSSLNPSLTCGFQVMEILLEHKKMDKSEAKTKVIELFLQVKLPRVEEMYNQYPHQLSGGQKQRVMIAMAIACKPEILIADEPTTALDVTVQKEIIKLLRELQIETGMSIIFISHDLSLVSEIADRMLVMQHGVIVEQGNTKKIFENPENNYTKALINSKPSLQKRLKKLPTVEDFLNDKLESDLISTLEREKKHKLIYSKTPLLEIQNLKTYFSTPKSFFSKPSGTVKAVDNVSLKVYEGETLGLVGESGCGKTTLGRTILHLEKATSGNIFYKGKEITKLSLAEIKKLRKEVQIIFQDPFSSLNPRIPVGKAIAEPMKVHKLYNSEKERKQKTLEILSKVGLEEEHYNRYP